MKKLVVMPICRQDHLSAVTFQDNEMFHELCGKIEKLVHYKIEHFRLVFAKSHGSFWSVISATFRSCFPFACPKSDLAIILKLFSSVSVR